MIGTFRNLLFRDFRLKLFSLMLAVLVWSIISLTIHKGGTPVPAVTLPGGSRLIENVPVVVLSTAADVHDFRVDPKEVTVTVQGDPKLVRGLQARDIRAMVDLTGIEEATLLRKRIEISTPPGITHVRVDPEDVRIIFPRQR
jgi:YbbR domain-containing protein